MGDAACRPPVVLDCGTGYLKAGLAGCPDPTLVEPTVLGYSTTGSGSRTLGGGGSKHPLADTDYVIGSAALGNAAFAPTYPMSSGVITDFDGWEKLVGAVVYKHLQVFPEDHNFILTEPPLNSPENREATAEIMFETFDAAGLHIGVQAVLALYASFAAAARKSQGGSLTGVVVDSGDGCTHVIPVADGYVIGSSIRSVPLAGRDITSYVQQLLREGGQPVPPEQSLEVARQVKEQHCYVCSDPAKERQRYAAEPQQWRRQYSGTHYRTGQPFAVDVGCERFLGPEIFFQPQLYSSSLSTPLPDMIDGVIQSCPIDTRRALYNNVVLSGGTTIFRDFGKRIQRDLRRAVDSRTVGAASQVDVSVVSHPIQRYAVWFGGSVLGMTPGFRDIVVTREQYQEHGPGIVRNNAVYREW